jgi:hypothetical protein
MLLDYKDQEGGGIDVTAWVFLGNYCRSFLVY